MNKKYLKIFAMFMVTLLILVLVSCGVDTSAKYPDIEIFYEYNYIGDKSIEILRNTRENLGYNFVKEDSKSFFVYIHNGETKKLSKAIAETISEYVNDNGNEYFIVNFWGGRSWNPYIKRYGLHENGYIISLDDGTRWDFKKGQTALSVDNGYAYYVEGVKIYKVNLQDEKDKEVVYTFPFKKKLPKTPIVNIEGVETELYSTYTFVINEDGILIQSKIRDSDDVYTFADIKY